jgi:hypothetical protein
MKAALHGQVRIPCIKWSVIIGAGFFIWMFSMEWNLKKQLMPDGKFWRASASWDEH